MCFAEGDLRNLWMIMGITARFLGEFDSCTEFTGMQGGIGIEGFEAVGRLAIGRIILFTEAIGEGILHHLSGDLGVRDLAKILNYTDATILTANRTSEDLVIGNDTIRVDSCVIPLHKALLAKAVALGAVKRGEIRAFEALQAYVAVGHLRRALCS